MFIVEYVERAGRYLDMDTALAFDEPLPINILETCMRTTNRIMMYNSHLYFLNTDFLSSPSSDFSVLSFDRSD